VRSANKKLRYLFLAVGARNKQFFLDGCNPKGPMLKLVGSINGVF
jgi:hypothetical protein